MGTVKTTHHTVLHSQDTISGALQKLLHAVGHVSDDNHNNDKQCIRSAITHIIFLVMAAVVSLPQ